MSKINPQSNRLLVHLGVLFLLVLMAFPGTGWGYSRETAVVRAVREMGPAVVNISSEYEVRERAYPFGGFGMHPFFDSFF